MFSDAHVATDKAVSDAIRNGMKFIPPAGYPESLANALRHSEEGGALGGPAFHWDIALDLGDNAGLWDLPDDNQGAEVVAPIQRAEEAQARGHLSGLPAITTPIPVRSPRRRASRTTGGSANTSIRSANIPEFSRVDRTKRPYPVEGEWDRYTFKVGNIRFLMMSDRNDLPFPVGRQDFGGGSPAGAVTGATWDWWKKHVEAASDEIIVSCHHHMLRETTVGSGDYEGVSRYPDGRYRHGRYHGVDGVPEGASYLYFVDDEPKAHALRALSRSASWRGGHLARRAHPHLSRRCAQRPQPCGAQMGQ